MACFIAYVECWHAAALRIGAWHAGMFLIGVYYCIRNHVRNWLARRKNQTLALEGAGRGALPDGPGVREAEVITMDELVEDLYARIAEDVSRRFERLRAELFRRQGEFLERWTAEMVREDRDSADWWKAGADEEED